MVRALSRRWIGSAQPVKDLPSHESCTSRLSFGNPADSESPVALRSPLARELPFSIQGFAIGLLNSTLGITVQFVTTKFSPSAQARAESREEIDQP